jgi:hypothetical protein
MSGVDETPVALPEGVWQELLRDAFTLIDEIARHGIAPLMDIWCWRGPHASSRPTAEQRHFRATPVSAGQEPRIFAAVG